MPHDRYVTSLSAAECVVQMADRPWLRNPFQSVHAVALTNLGELASGLIVMGQIDELNQTRTVSARGIVGAMHIVFHKKARGTVVAKSSVVVPTTDGAHTLTVETKMYAGKNHDLVATFTADWAVTVRSKSQ